MLGRSQDRASRLLYPQPGKERSIDYAKDPAVYVGHGTPHASGLCGGPGRLDESPTDGSCLGTKSGDAIYGIPTTDTVYGYGGSDLINGYGGGDVLRGGNETGTGDKMLAGADLVNGQGGDDLIEGGPGRDTLNTGTGSDRVNARDGERDTITCDGSNDAVYYDRGLDVLEGCTGNGLTELPPPDGLFESGSKVLVDHAGDELCVPEKALKGHLEHGDEVLSWSGCTGRQ